MNLSVEFWDGRYYLLLSGGLRLRQLSQCAIAAWPSVAVMLGLPCVGDLAGALITTDPIYSLGRDGVLSSITWPKFLPKGVHPKSMTDLFLAKSKGCDSSRNFMKKSECLKMTVQHLEGVSVLASFTSAFQKLESSERRTPHLGKYPHKICRAFSWRRVQTTLGKRSRLL